MTVFLPNKKTSALTAAEVIIPFFTGRIQANLIAVSIVQAKYAL